MWWYVFYFQRCHDSCWQCCSSAKKQKQVPAVVSKWLRSCFKTLPDPSTDSPAPQHQQKGCKDKYHCEWEGAIIFESCQYLKENFQLFQFSTLLIVIGECESGASGVADENRMAAVLRDSPPSVPTHSTEELLQAACCIPCCREAAGLGGRSGGTAEQFHSLFLRAAGIGHDRRRSWNCPHTGKP